MHRFTLSRQLVLFLLIGGAQVALDTAIFIAATALGLPVSLGNVLGRIGGASVGFWLNGRYTFARGDRPVLGRTQLLRFVVAWLLLTLLSTVLVTAIAQQISLSWAWLGKPAVEALIAALGFFIWRHWVYR